MLGVSVVVKYDVDLKKSFFFSEVRSTVIFFFVKSDLQVNSLNTQVKYHLFFKAY